LQSTIVSAHFGVASPNIGVVYFVGFPAASVSRVISNMQLKSTYILRSVRSFAIFAAALSAVSAAAEAQQVRGRQQQAQQPPAAAQPAPAAQPAQQGQQAQQAQQQQPKSPWTKLCDKIKVAATPPAEGTPPEKVATKQVNLCVTLQERVNNTDGGLVFSGSVRQQEGTDGDFLTVIVPLGLDLRGGVGAKIDNGKPIKLDYMSCLQIGCTAEVKLPAGTLDQMKSGKEIAIEAVGANRRPVKFSLPLMGFATTLDGPSTNIQQYQASRQQVIAAIQRRRQQEIQQAVQEADRRRAQQQQQPAPQAAPPAAPAQ
jgi:invasion protein IalB